MQTELDRRFLDDEQAARLADIAIRHLGPSAGFDRILELLRHFNAAQREAPSEQHVVVAGAVAMGWHLIEEAAAGRPDADQPLDQAEAAAVLASHDAATIAADCMAVPTRHGLSWHIDSIIYTWPALTAQYSIDELRNDAHVSEGLPDRIHSAVLLAHSKLESQQSAEALDLALDLLTALPPELREVLAHEQLAPIPVHHLLDVLSAWTSDQDDGVRRTSAIGITRALQRSESDPAAHVLFTQWRETVRSNLVAYGSSLDEDRQIAWTCMLLLGSPELLDGLVETIGDPTPPGVRLTDIYGNPDDILIELVARQWRALVPHLGDDPLMRLSDSRSKPDADHARALRALLAVSDDTPIVDLIEDRIAAEKAAGGESRTQSMVEFTPAGVDYLIAQHGRVAENFRKVLKAADHDIDSYGDRHAHRERWAFTRLTEDWDIDDDAREALLLEVTGVLSTT